ncbi:PQQ-dependent sugar dehydrogenase [Microbacteriaceae bacterium VKM Ac-2854]|nr:PQQ-dependent sugar dehydrogenase [Microbacteriaceae bacterium VKM Ac-2854]
MRRHAVAVALLAGAALVGCSLTGCSPAGPAADSDAANPSSPPRPTASTTPVPLPTPVRLMTPTGEPTVVAEELDAPWSIRLLTDGTTLVSERDTALIREIAGDGTVRDVGEVPGVRPGGEAGLLGLALAPGDEGTLYAYVTGAEDNRVLSIPLRGDSGSRTLGEPTPILTGIPKAGNHNGGRIAFGPDGMLYVTVGDAGDAARAQDPVSLGGKILRIAPDGSVPADNPTAGSPVYTLGHRNPQGIAWTDDGRMWASEFGQNTWDELNAITPGANYGWPAVEGVADDRRYVDPIAQWATDDASPSGLAAIGDTLFVAALKGERIWSVDVADGIGTPQAWFAGEYGRIRDVAEGPGGTLRFVTNNTDGRGDPSDGDDRLWQVGLVSG